MKTALQKIQKRLDTEINFINEDDCQADKFYQQGLKLALSICKEYLEEEKQQIIEAISEFGMKSHAEQYYQETFGDSNQDGI